MSASGGPVSRQSASGAEARSAMGGPGSIRAWRRAGLAQRDFVHFTRDGYRQLAEAFLSALLGAYDAWITPR